MTAPDVMKEVYIERMKQSDTWDEKNDDGLTVEQWACLISHYANRHIVGDFSMITWQDIRTDFIKIGAIAMAAVEAIDRKSVITRTSP